jgi:hypothetical protein
MKKQFGQFVVLSIEIWTYYFDCCHAGENVRAQLVSPRHLVHARMETKRLQIYMALYGAIYKTV